MSLGRRLQYYRRIFNAYLLPGKSQITFWHDTPTLNLNAIPGELGEYNMDFSRKADYPGHHDAAGIPMLDYHGQIGLQYNPIAIAQWGLGNCDLFTRTRNQDRRKKFLAAADWLCDALQPNSFGVFVWNHLFDWEYRTRLRAPWYSGLAQGQGISLLVRAYKQSQSKKYLQSAERVFESFLKPVAEGGVIFTDEKGDLWIEEYIVNPPTHILNGFMWACWGVYDYFLATGDMAAKEIFAASVKTLRVNLEKYDLGYWSLYEQAGLRLPMVASSFYHQLHIVQLRVMHRLTGDDFFAACADRWQSYASSRTKRLRALFSKSLFKLCYY